MNSPRNAHKFHHPLVFSLVLLIVLMLPLAYYFAWENPDWPSLLKVTLASAALVAILLTVGKIFCLKLPRSTAWLVGLIVTGLLILRFFYVLLLDFSGRGFTSEVFLHTEWNAVKIGASEYALPLLVLAVSVLGLFVWIVRHPFWHRKPFDLPAGLFRRNTNRTDRPVAWGGAILIISAFASLYLIGKALPSAELIRAYKEFTSHGDSNLLFDAKSRDESIARALKWLEPIRGKKPLPTPKDRLQATASPDSPNLILVYLESFNDMFTENPDFPGLTPNIDALKKRFTVLANNYSSAYVTIEGIANSQCGTLMNMQFSNNSLTTPSGRLPGMACLGDILKRAGYAQTYLGGAKSEFAGKGDFFTDHGYDKVLGWNDWKRQGFHKEERWGLPDTHLFEQALDIVESYRKNKIPYNVTLLTLGTHLPGYSYKGCPKYPYKPEEQFLNAIHCTDYLLGLFIGELEKRGILNDTVLYVQGDHGVFNTTEMIRLFGKEKVKDHRVLTLFSIPKENQNTSDAAKQPDNQEGSTYDTVATLLDFLNIQHNTDFVLSESMTTTREKARYLLTRNFDYFKGHRYKNTDIPEDRKKPLSTRPSLPLSAHDKRLTLQAIYAINDLYSLQGNNFPVCNEGLAVAKKRNSLLIQTKWLGTDISDKFRENGFLVSTAKPGAIMILLDQQGKLISQAYYNLDIEESAKSLNAHLNRISTGTTVIVARNIEANDVSTSAFKLWPQPLKKYTVFVARGDAKPAALSKNNRGTVLKLLFSESAPEFGFRIYPPTCHRPIETGIHVSDPPPSVFCPIEKWGPKSTVLGKDFNSSRKGHSSFWFKTNCAPENTHLFLDGKLVRSVIDLPLIAAPLNSSPLVQQAGKHTLELVDTKTGDTQFVGYFSVIDPSKPVPKSKTSNGKQKAQTKAFDKKPSDIKASSHKRAAQHAFCEIKKWGPKKLTAGAPFNPQPDGSSAFWIVTDCVPPGAVAYLDDQPLITVGGPPQLAALLPPGSEPAQPGKYSFSLKDPNTGQKLEIGTIYVRQHE